MSEDDIYIQRLLEGEPLREPVMRSAIQSLHLPLGSQGLDVGCGIGLPAMQLAQTVGAAGHVTGVDILPELLRYGEELVRKAGLSERITFREGDMNQLPFADASFDWTWSADCVGYPAGGLTHVLEELIRVVKPGGSVILLAWSSQQLLPGYPFLEARLNATCSGYLPLLKEISPQQHFPHALGWLKEAGLDQLKGQTFIGDVQAPLNPGERIALLSLFEMLWGQRLPECSPEDWNEFQRLCSPGSTDFILDIPDYYAFFTYTLFRGRVLQSIRRREE